MTWIDWGERGFLLVLYVAFARLLLNSGGTASLALVATEGLAVVLVLTRRRASLVSTHPWPWAVAIAATLAPMMLRPGGAPVVPWLALPMSLGGLVLATLAKLALSRRLGMAPANRGVQDRWV